MSMSSDIIESPGFPGKYKEACYIFNAASSVCCFNLFTLFAEIFFGTLFCGDFMEMNLSTAKNLQKNSPSYFKSIQKFLLKFDYTGVLLQKCRFLH